MSNPTSMLKSSGLPVVFVTTTVNREVRAERKQSAVLDILGGGRGVFSSEEFRQDCVQLSANNTLVINHLKYSDPASGEGFKTIERALHDVTGGDSRRIVDVKAALSSRSLADVVARVQAAYAMKFDGVTPVLGRDEGIAKVTRALSLDGFTATCEVKGMIRSVMDQDMDLQSVECSFVGEGRYNLSPENPSIFYDITFLNEIVDDWVVEEK